MSKKVFSSQKSLADRLGISQPRVSKLISDPDWSHGNGPWSESTVKRIESELSDRRSSANASASGSSGDDANESRENSTLRSITQNPEKLARIKLLIERTSNYRIRNAVLSGKWIEREKSDQLAHARVLSVRAKLQEIPLRAPLIAGKTEIECEQILAQWMKEVCDYYASGGN